jgi:hypothetical protein
MLRLGLPPICALAMQGYELAKAAKLGYEIPTSLFLQDIRD